MTARAAAPAMLRPLPIVFGVAVVLAIVTAWAGRITGPVGLPDPGARPVAERDLRFADTPTGGVEVIDATDGKTIALLAPGSNAFLRATMRVLAHQRIRNDGTQESPFRLTAWNDGRLTLVDAATGRSVGLEAFGIDNETVFARLLTARTTP